MSVSRTPKMTEKELEKVAESLKCNIGRKCQVVPFDSAEWVSGFIAGIAVDKGNRRVFYAIKLSNGKRVVKAYDSKLIRIGKEVVEKEKLIKNKRPVKEKKEYTDEQMYEDVQSVIHNVGRLVHLASGEEGRIIAISANRSCRTPYYTIAIPEPTYSNPYAVRKVERSMNSKDIVIEDGYDDKGEKINAAYRKKRETTWKRKHMTPQELVIFREQELASLERYLKFLNGRLEEKKRLLEEARQELEKYFLSCKDDAEDAAAGTSAEA